ncbi:Ypar14, superfamily integron cassette [Candidatus Riflebacteria bacterium]
MLVWDEVKFLEFFAIEPEVGDYEVSHYYKIEKDGLLLEVTINQYSGDVYLELCHTVTESTIFQIKITDCQMIKLIKSRDGEYLEIAPGKVFGNRYDEDFTIPYGIRLKLNPHICISMFKK